MKTYTDEYRAFEENTAKEPRFVVQLAWDDADTDYTYLTSSSDAQVPSTSPAVDTIHNAVLAISGQTQKINPDIATSTIGAITVTLSDVSDNAVSPALPMQVTTRMNTKLAAGDGLRGKIARVYVGYENMPFDRYDLRLTYIVDSITYKDAIYKLKLTDIQRQERHKIFSPDETNLSSSVLMGQMTLPVSAIDTGLFQRTLHGTEMSFSPGEFVTYVKIDDEVIGINGGISFDTVLGWYYPVFKRGALNTREADHIVNLDLDDDRKTKVVEHIYIEAAAPKAIYGILTGLMYNGENKLADQFDFNTWTASNVTIAESGENTPTGWGATLTLTDTSGAARGYIYESVTDDYIHGDTWTGSVFLLKESVSSAEPELRLQFVGGSGASEYYVSIDPVTGGVVTAANTSVTNYGGEILDYGDYWFFRVWAATSVGGTTTSIRLNISPDASSAAATGSASFFGANLNPGETTGMTVLPDHWHLGISADFARLSDFKTLGVDLWNVETDYGRPVRIENPGQQDGKKYIEKEILLWLGAFMPVYSTGEIGIRNLAGILSDSSYQAVLDSSNIVSYGDLNHDMRSVINDIRVKWNYVDSREVYTKENFFVDAESIAIHGVADSKEFKFNTVHTGIHTDESLLTYFDVLRDRYSGPPMRLPLKCLPSMSRLEVGDTVRVTLDQIRDFNTGTYLDRTFEVQQVTTNWNTGDLSLQLFGSSQAAGTLDRSTLASVLLDSFYTALGTNLTSVLTIVAGHVTGGGTLTGTSDITSGNSVFYYDGDLIIDAGVTVTIEENVQLRIKGALEVIGTIEGVANGCVGGAATTTFWNSTTTSYRATLYGEHSPIKYNQGELGYYGQPLAPGALQTGYNFSYSSTVPADSTIGIAPGGESTAIGHSSLIFFSLDNDQQTNILSGYPYDLRGSGGISGRPYIHSATNATNDGYKYMLTTGGAGGAGGAGLLVICRGMSFSGAGEIDLSGGPSSIGSSYTHTTTDKFYGSAGAPGAPGALLILIDGAATNPDITENTFVAKYGDMPVPVGAALVNFDDIVVKAEWNWWEGVSRYTLSGTGTSTAWDFGDAVADKSKTGGVTENINVYGSAHRIQYIPPDQTPQLSDDSVPDIPEYGYRLVTLMQDSTVAANDFFGVSAYPAGDGSRLVIVAGTSTTTKYMYIYNGAVNGAVEFTASDPWSGGGTFNRTFTGSQLNNDGTFCFSPKTDAVSDDGTLPIYNRAGNTWTNYQTISNPSGFADSQFGLCEQNGDGSRLMINRRTTLTPSPSQPSAIEYYELDSASPPQWQHTQTLETPGLTDEFGKLGDDGAMAMAGDQSHFIASDIYYDVGGSSQVGGAFLWQYTGGSPAWEKYSTEMTPESAANINCGTDVAINYTGEWFAVSCTEHASLLGACFIYNRDGTSISLYQTIEGDAAGDYFGAKLAMTDNALSLAVLTGSGGSIGLAKIKIYKRGATSVPFKLFQTLDVDATSSGIGSKIKFTANGEFLVVGNSRLDIGATDAGGVQIYQSITSVT